MPDKYSPRERIELSPERAAQMVAEQELICKILSTREVTDVMQLPPETISVVQLHIITCSEQHYPIQGLTTSDE